MESWRGRVALVTGACGGIGAAVCQELSKQGMKVIGCDIHIDQLKSLQDNIAKSSQTSTDSFYGMVMTYKCDLSKEEEILRMFKEIKEQFSGVDVCVNVAGVGHQGSLVSGSTECWRNMFEINVLAYAICSREAIAHMRERDVHGHIINVSSMSGHRIRPGRGDFSFYNVTKSAVGAMTESLKHELRELGTKIRVSQISPGIVETDFTHRMYKYKDEDVAQWDELYKSTKILQANDVAEGIVFMLSRPAHVQVQDIWMWPQNLKL